jgi:hypothetical protein
MAAGVPDGLGDIGSVQDGHDQFGMLVNGAVPDPARLVVASVCDTDDRTADGLSEPRECLGSHSGILVWA